MFTGTRSVAALPWLGDRAVGGRVTLAESALVELVLRVGDEVGCDHLRDLTCCPR